MKNDLSSHSGFCGLIIVFFLVIAIGFSVQSAYVLRVVAIVAIMGIAAIGLQILMGLGGQISLGQAGFVAIGAYTSAILPARFAISPIFAVGAGALCSAAVAYLVGKPILRLRGNYLAIATLGLSLLAALIVTNAVDWTGGPDGMNVERLSVFGAAVASPEQWYWIAGAALIIAIAIALALRDSPTGRALRAILESEVAAASMGVDVPKRKLQAFVIAAVYGSIAGSLLALMNGFITPDVSSFMASVEFVAMVVIGGSVSPYGALIGAAFLTLTPQIMATLYDYQDIVLGLLIMVTAIFLREGIVPAISQVFIRKH